MDLDQDEFGDLSAERLFALIERLPAYEGAVAGRIFRVLEADKQGPQLASNAVPVPQGAVVADSSSVGLRSNPAIAEWVEVAEV